MRIDLIETIHLIVRQQSQVFEVAHMLDIDALELSIKMSLC